MVQLEPFVQFDDLLHIPAAFSRITIVQGIKGKHRVSPCSSHSYHRAEKRFLRSDTSKSYRWEEAGVLSEAINLSGSAFDEQTISSERMVQVTGF